MLRTAPNGDIFVAESYAGRIHLLRASGRCNLGGSSVFASGLNRPFGIAFYPPGANPRYLYVDERTANIFLSVAQITSRRQRPQLRPGASLG